MRKHFLCYSSSKESPEEATDDCLDQYQAFLGRFDDPHPLSCVFFTPDTRNGAYLATKARLERASAGLLHQFSCIAQAPYRSHLAMEVTILDSPGKDFRVSHKTVDGIAYTAIESDLEKELYLSGVCGHLEDSIYRQTEDAFARSEAILNAEGMDFSNVYRQWNYIERIIEFDPDSQAKRQHYQIFNDVRSEYYSRTDFHFGYPAATGIGMAAGGIIMDMIASRGNRIRHVPIMNPDQLDAHCYTQYVLVGEALKPSSERTTPKFERAKYVECGYNHSLYISGTAAIKGEKTIPSGDIAEQTRITLDNIAKLHYNDSHRRPYRHMRAYVKDPRNIPIVERLCRQYFGDIPMQYLKADVCRENLVVEIEAEIDLI